MNRRFDRQPEPGRYYPPRPGVYAVVVAPGGLLITCQEKPWPELQLPGGGIDPGEAPLPALHREVMEETGMRIAVERHLGMFHRFTYMPDYERYAQKLCHVYLARLGTRMGSPTEPGHHAMILPWDVAEAEINIEGDVHFIGVARRLLGV